MSFNNDRPALTETILEIANWRRENAVEYPNDDRYVPAAELLEKIAASVDEVPDGLMQQYEEALGDHMIGPRASDAQSMLLRGVGFDSITDNATKLIENLMDHVADARADLDQD